MAFIYATRRNHTSLRIFQCVLAVAILDVLAFPTAGPFWRKKQTGGELGNYLSSKPVQHPKNIIRHEVY